MGNKISHAASAPITPPPPPLGPQPGVAGLPPDVHTGGSPAEGAGETPAAAPEKVDYLNLPCPVKYEEIQREALSE